MLSMNNATVPWPYRNSLVEFQSAFAFRNTVTISLSTAKCYKFVIFKNHVKQEILLGYVFISEEVVMIPVILLSAAINKTYLKKVT